MSAATAAAPVPATVGSGKELANPPTDGIYNLRFSNHSDHLLVSSWDRTVRLYDANTNVLKDEFVHAGAVLDCCFHDDSSGFSAGADHTVRSLNPLAMDGLDALLAKSKHHTKRVDPDIDGFPQAQTCNKTMVQLKVMKEGVSAWREE
ncbi:hypothetical protein E2562_025724 [Oryza meyeriana var. granulata]|uniref:Mitotic checkpoint protein BUB3 n=1 Tax=Oryza meyeriana var. granulata TaxID=110450 RepID=A0A6G1CST4_9ORYZ|nr:hypothetical protein E2562_025724 [Oryza meyeriana var. granulata]KAF0903138.1 hypothetical protein E2562_025724 [Oryza meyeriana var. granulata]KAF0903139.1 hypothetical protein E2562_025724 [Oryza meyeriana var. granulata]